MRVGDLVKIVQSEKGQANEPIRGSSRRDC